MRIIQNILKIHQHRNEAVLVKFKTKSVNEFIVESLLSYNVYFLNLKNVKL